MEKEPLFTNIEPKTARAIIKEGMSLILLSQLSEDDYLRRLPRIEAGDDVRVGDFYSCGELGEELKQRGLSKMQRAAVTNTLGFFSSIDGPTVGQFRRMPNKEVLGIKSGDFRGRVGIRRLIILRLLFGHEEREPLASD